MRQLIEVEIGKLTPSKTNPRKKFEGIDDLANSIAEKGIINPILVRPQNGGYEIVSGERRFRAIDKLVKLDKHPKVLNVLCEEISDEEVLELQITENLQREDVHPMDEADAMYKLGKEGKDYAEIGKVLGKPAAYVRKVIQLRNLIPEIKKMFKKNVFTVSQAFIICTFNKEIQSLMLENSLIKEDYDDKPYCDLTPLQIKRLAQRLTINLDEAPFDLTDKSLAKKGYGSCIGCSENTGTNHTMFEDILEGAKCMNPDCYSVKMNNHMDNLFKELQEDGKPFIVGSIHSYIPKDETFKGVKVVSVADKELIIESNPAYIRCLMIDGVHMGNVVYISKTAKPKAERNETEIEGKYRKMKERFAREDKRDRIEIREKLMFDIFQTKAGDEFKEVEWELILDALISKYGRNLIPVFEHFGYPYESDQEKRFGRVNGFADVNNVINALLENKSKDKYIYRKEFVKCLLASYLLEHTSKEDSLDNENPLVKLGDEYKLTKSVYNEVEKIKASRGAERKAFREELRKEKKELIESEKAIAQYIQKGIPIEFSKDDRITVLPTTQEIGLSTPGLKRLARKLKVKISKYAEHDDIHEAIIERVKELAKVEL